MSRTQRPTKMPFVTLTQICLHLLLLSTDAFDITLSPSEPQIFAHIRDPISITCEASGCSNPSFTWSSLLDKTLSGTVTNIGQKSILNMSSVSMESEGSYRCKVSCNKETKERSFTISVYSFPLDPELQISSLQVGAPSVITCSFRLIYPIERLDVSMWLGTELITTDNETPELTDTEININRSYSWVPTEKDEGKRVRCEGHMTFEQDGPHPLIRSTEQVLSLKCFPRDPELSILPAPTVAKGENVTIQCTVPGASDTVTIWKVCDTGSILLQDKQGTVHIDSVQPHDSGVYKCRTNNTLGERETEELLTVEYAPRNTVISASSPIVDEGGSVTLSCVSEGVPAPRISLHQHLPSGESLQLSAYSEAHLTNVQSRSSGVYECISVNKLGSEYNTLELLVQAPPRNTQLTIIPSEVVKAGDLVTLSCTSEASPAPTLALKRKTKHGLVDLGAEGGTLSIFHAKEGHAGTYICQSTNTVGQQITEAKLSVQVPPRNSTVLVLPSENVTEGDTVIITCETHSIPSPTILLQKVCSGNNTFLQAKNGTFTLHNVTRNDTGTYMVSIINEAGSETEVIEILVKERRVSDKHSVTTPVIVGSLAVVSACILGAIVYHLKQARQQGSYNLLTALKSIV
ncbi:vascular cell adhesion protein 1 [Bombina bombina]|uniref:vascular cell adhesion protein 1 n=1 Tax=Bombina bombina TaxID=8345 RepID=UPI00235A5C9B|nr:vascular cell adhesion protein 1 [Bombina bombina]